MRPLWKGHIRFLLVAIPVRIYKAIEPKERIHLNFLHEKDFGRIAYDKRCRKCGKEVTKDDLVKGYEFKPDEYAIIEPEDLKKIRLKTTKVIDIVGFVDQQDLPVTFYDESYYIGPDGEVSLTSYGLLRDVLKETGKVGIGQIVFREREDLIAITPFKEGMALLKLYYPNEIRKIESVAQIDAVHDVNRNELKLARTLIDQMEMSIEDLKVKDRYGEALRHLVKAKIAGKEIAVSKEEEPEEPVDIMQALKESIREAGRKPMVKARGAHGKKSESRAGRKKKSA